MTQRLPEIERMRPCLWCEEEFLPSHNSVKHCSAECLYGYQVTHLGQKAADKRARQRASGKRQREHEERADKIAAIEEGYSPVTVQFMSPERIERDWDKIWKGLATAPRKRQPSPIDDNLSKICRYQHCDNPIPDNRRKFCSIICCRRYHQKSLPRPETRVCNCGKIFRPRRRRDLCCGNPKCYNRIRRGKDRTEYYRAYHQTRKLSTNVIGIG